MTDTSAIPDSPVEAQSIEVQNSIVIIKLYLLEDFSAASAYLSDNLTNVQNQ